MQFNFINGFTEKDRSDFNQIFHLEILDFTILLIEYHHGEGYPSLVLGLLNFAVQIDFI